MEEVAMKADSLRTLKQRKSSVPLFAAGMIGALLSSAAAQEPRDREAFFGETHVHTGWSFDAYVFGNTKTDPTQAYQYAIGETIQHPMGYDIKITTPLDWMGVTDHSEYAGTVMMANTPGTPLSRLPIAEKLKVRSAADIQRIYLWLGYTIVDKKPVKELVDPKVAGSVWKQNNEIADRFNKPGQFTAFCSYEWTSTPNNSNMHRNVFFKDCAKVPEVPFSAIDSVAPEDLWVDGQAARGRHRAACHLAQRQSVRRHHVSAGRRLQGPADRPGLGRVAHAQRTSHRDQADQGRIGNASAPLAERRVREFRDPDVPAR
jgi:hypothetical protein